MSHCWTVLVGVVFNGLEDGFHGLHVEAEKLLLAFSLREDQAAAFEGLKVVANHALFLVQGFGDGGDVHRARSKFLHDGESCWVGEGMEEAVAGLGEISLHRPHHA